MKTHTEGSFLDWAKSHGMGLDPRWPQSAVLTFSPDPDLDRFWVVVLFHYPRLWPPR